MAYFEKGNLLTFTFGTASGWATINFIELQTENSTFPAEPLKLEEASLVVSLVNLGGFIGIFVVLPMIHLWGVKRSIHISAMAFIVRNLIEKRNS